MSRYEVSNYNLNTLATVVRSTGGDDTARINNAIASLPAEGGEVYLPDATYTITSHIVIAKPGVILRGRTVDRWGTSSITNGTRIVINANDSGIRITRENVIIKDLAIDNTDASNTSAGIDATPDPNNGANCSSNLQLDNVYVHAFQTGINSLSMSGNNGGYFHRYRDIFVFPPTTKTGSTGIKSNSNSLVIESGQVSNFDKGIDCQFTKGIVNLEVSGCNVGWYNTSGTDNHAVLACESNTQNVAFNDSSTNARNIIQILYAGGTISSSDLPSSNGNVLIFNQKIFGQTPISQNIQVPVYMVVWNDGTGTLHTSSGAMDGFVASVTHVSTGIYQVNLKANIPQIGVTLQIMGDPTLHATIVQSNLTSGIASGNNFQFAVYNGSNALADLPNDTTKGIHVCMMAGAPYVYNQP